MEVSGRFFNNSNSRAAHGVMEGPASVPETPLEDGKDGERLGRGLGTLGPRLHFGHLGLRLGLIGGLGLTRAWPLLRLAPP